MPINFDTSGRPGRLGLGVGLLRIGPTGATPSTTAGYVRQASLQITRTRLEVLQGVPRTPVFQFVQAEELVFNWTGLEWDISKIRDVLAITNSPTGLSGNGGGLLGFGGDTNLRSVALHFQNQMPSGGTINLYVWKAQGTGESTVTFGDEVHEFPQGYRAIVATTEWGGNTLAATEQLCRFDIVAPPGGFV